MPELHLRQLGFIYSACRPFTKHRERIQKFKETSDLNYIYKNRLHKACLAHDAAYSDSNDLAKRTISDKILKGRAYKIAINPKYDYIKEDWQVLCISFVIKKQDWEQVQLKCQLKNYTNH